MGSNENAAPGFPLRAQERRSNDAMNRKPVQTYSVDERQIFRSRLSVAARDQLVFDFLSFVQAAETSLLNR